LELFNTKFVQALIGHKWLAVRGAYLRKSVLPYTLYLLTFFIWRSYIYNFVTMEHRFSMWNYLLTGLMVFFASNFILNEAKQMRDTGRAYFSDATNLFDMVPFCLVTFVSLNYIISSTRLDLETFFVATSSLCMWVKILGFGRLHREAAYMIRMLAQVFDDIKPFMTILCLTILAFADASYAVSNAITDPTKRYFEAYWQSLLRSYLIALGDFNYGAYNDSG
jgi:hypothetical protein